MSTLNHKFVRPSDGDSRSPCPALNALANHSYLPHDGRDISAFQLTSALRKHYHLSLPFAAMLSIVGTLTCGRYFKIDLGDLAQHNVIEHDASLTHADAMPGSTYAPIDVDDELLQKLLDVSPNRNYLTLDDLVKVRAARDAALDQPSAYFMVALTAKLFTNPEGQIPKQYIREWFGEQRLPEGWYGPKAIIGFISTTRLVHLVGELVKKVTFPKKGD
ncbi:Cloroperoxidase [Lactifluus volemus]|nr:Cloroperoxidase [Lactifluus volemus]